MGSVLHNLLDINQTLVSKMRLYKHGKLHRNQVNGYLKGKRTLTEEETVEAKVFWCRYVKKFNPLFHEWYKQSTGSFYSEFIPDDIWYSKVDYFFNDKAAGEAIDNKCLYNLFFGGGGVNLPETIAKRMNGYWLINDKIVELEKVASVCAQKKAVVLKVAIGSCGGKGVHFLESPQMSEELDRLNNSIQNDIIIQDVIHQHDALSALNVSSVNTIRVLSLLRKSGVKICSVVLRMGIGDSRVDNASSGGITCGVREDGTLKSIAYNKKGESFTCHPTTKASFEGVTIPAYDEMIEATRELALRLPMFRMISWDWTVDEDSKPVLIEANLFNGELDFHQLNNGPIFGEDTQEILNEVFSSTK